MPFNTEKELENYLTKPDTRSKEQIKAIEIKKAKAEAARRDKKRQEYGLDPIFSKRFVEVSNKYDGTNYAVDSNNNIVEQKDL